MTKLTENERDTLIAGIIIGLSIGIVTTSLYYEPIEEKKQMIQEAEENCIKNGFDEIGSYNIYTERSETNSTTKKANFRGETLKITYGCRYKK